MDLRQLLEQVVLHHSSDLHMKVGLPPVVRLVNGDLYPVEGLPSFSVKDILEMARTITSSEKFSIFEEKNEVDFSYGLPHLGRFRVNFYMEKDGPAIAFRVIPDQIPSADALLLPAVVHTLAMKPRGLVLVTGPTGSGKSTTLASMIDFINHNRRCHILTIEDPIEFVFEPVKAFITQREIDYHTKSFATAMRSAFRQDPDVIMVGEMRDLETISAAVTLAESGHLVLSTLHTTDAPQTIDRVIDVFPSHQQQQIRMQLSLSLQGVISQTIIPRSDGKGRVVAFEIMISNDAVRNCIKEANVHQIYSMMQIGRAGGMQTLDDALNILYKKGLITRESALSKAHDAEFLNRMLSR